MILTSNISGADGENRLYVDYDSCTNDDEMVADHAGLMLLKLLKRCGEMCIRDRSAPMRR